MRKMQMAPAAVTAKTAKTRCWDVERKAQALDADRHAILPFMGGFFLGREFGGGTQRDLS